jgi:hypothetical protein
MKQFIKIFALILIINVVFAILPQQLFAQQEDDSYQEFYDQLSPYGHWDNDPSYGSIWYPKVDSDFTPYLTNGYWVMTEYGMTWVSNYEWGWAPFHYGRWDYDSYNGWFWIPDYEWAPSWVLWRKAEGYYGWTAMRPGFGVDRYGNLSHENWIFVKDNDIDRHDLAKILYSRKNNTMIYNNSAFIDRIHHDRMRQEAYFAGPGPEEVRRTIGRDMLNIKLVERDRPGHSVSKDRFVIYRPLMHHLVSEPVRSSNIAEPERRYVNEHERDRRPGYIPPRDVRNDRDRQNAFGNRANERDRQDQNRNANPPRDNRAGNNPNRDRNNISNKLNISPDHLRYPDQQGNNNTGQRNNQNQQGNNNNRNQQPASGNQNNNPNRGQQPPSGNQNNNPNRGQQPAATGQGGSLNLGPRNNSGQQNNTTNKGNQPSSGGQNNNANPGTRVNPNQPANNPNTNQQPRSILFKGNQGQQNNSDQQKNDKKDDKKEK